MGVSPSRYATRIDRRAFVAHTEAHKSLDLTGLGSPRRSILLTGGYVQRGGPRATDDGGRTGAWICNQPSLFGLQVPPVSRQAGVLADDGQSS